MKKNKLTSKIDDTKAPLMDHLVELRQRLIKCMLAIIIGCVLCAPFLKEIIEILIWPFDVAIDRYNFSLIASGAEGIKLDMIATHPMETFFVKLKITLFGGIVLSFPVIAYQFYRFIAPGLYRTERKAVLPYLVISPFLFILGASLVFFYVFPFVMEFALNQQNISDSNQIDLLTKISDYLRLSTTLFLAFGFSFQLPVVLSLLSRAGIVTSGALKRSRKYAVFFIAVFAAFVTPPDPITQNCFGKCYILTL